MDRKKTHKIIPFIAGGFFGILVILYLIFQFSVKGIKEDTLYYEAGYPATIEKEDLLQGPAFLVEWSSLDQAGFDPSKVGHYRITAKHGFISYKVTAVVRDTEAPVITANTEQLYEKVGEEVSVEDLIASVSDRGSSFTLSVDGADSVCENQVGEYTYKVLARDAYDNTSEQEVSVIFDTAPVISGYENYYVVPGTEVDYLSGITAYDDVDGDVTTSLVADASAVVPDEEGEYTFIVTATDGYGLSTEQEVTVEVASADAIQELINTHQIDRHTEHIIGAYNLYDGGYYTDDNIEQRLEDFDHAFVCVTMESGRYRSRGSGYIVKITDDQIIIITNSHVTSGCKEHYVEFYDDTRVFATLLGQTGHSCYNDVAILSVAVSDIPAELLDQLVTVHINESYWETAAEDGSLSLGLRTHDDSFGLLGDHEYTGVLLEKYKDAEGKGEETCYTVYQRGGCSGSAVIDGYGNLISMATFCYGPINGHYEQYGETLEQILDYYEEVMGEPLNYE